MSKVYEIKDRRKDEFIADRTLDEAIKNQLGAGAYLPEMSDNDKLVTLEDAGFTVRELRPITTLLHGLPLRGSEEIERHIQVDFNYEKATHNIDVHMEEHYGKMYFVIDFPECTDGIIRRMYDVYGNEKCIEWCSHCEEEVVLDAVECRQQMCPSCGEPILPCNLCGECDYRCSKDKEEDKDVRSNS
jgi:hypothetical protein